MNILTHLGLGDHLITYGLIRELESRHGAITIFCKKQNYQSLCSIYRDSKVSLLIIENEQQAYKVMELDPFNSLVIGYTPSTESELNFGESFYKQAGIDFSVRNKYKMLFSLFQAIFVPVFFNKSDFRPLHYTFIHDSDDYKIDKVGIRPNIDTIPDITSYCFLIENAEEVHVIESSFKQLIEFLNPKGKLFLHKFENKSFRVVSSRHDWTIINH